MREKAEMNFFTASMQLQSFVAALENLIFLQESAMEISAVEDKGVQASMVAVLFKHDVIKGYASDNVEVSLEGLWDTIKGVAIKIYDGLGKVFGFYKETVPKVVAKLTDNIAFAKTRDGKAKPLQDRYYVNYRLHETLSRCL